MRYKILCKRSLAENTKFEQKKKKILRLNSTTNIKVISVMEIFLLLFNLI